MNPQALTPGKLSTQDPAAAGDLAVSFNLTLSTPVGAQQIPLDVHTEGDTKVWSVQVHSKICTELNRSLLSLIR